MWFRPSIRRAAYRASGLAIVLLVAGAFILGGLRIANTDFGSPWLLAYALGLALVIAGPVVLWRRSYALLSHERVLTISRDGLRWQVGDDTTHFIAWSALETIEQVGAELVVSAVDTRWAVPLPLEDITAPALIALCYELRQKALLGLPVRPRA